MVKPQQSGDMRTYNTLKERSKADGGFESEIHRQELLDLKIEKLGNRLTFITILLPCFLVVILLVAYLDVKEKVSSIHNSGQNDVKLISEDLEAKLNGMNVAMAKMKLSMETTVPELLSDIETVRADFEKTVSGKAEKKQMENRLKAFKQNLEKDTTSIRKAIQTIEKANQKALLLVSETKQELSERLADIHRETAAAVQVTRQKFLELADSLTEERERMDNLGQALLGLDDQLAVLRKDVSLVKKQNDDLYSSTLDREDLNRELEALKAVYAKEIETLTLKITEKKGRVIKTPLPALKPKPGAQVQPSDSSLPTSEKPNPIVEKDLSQ